MLALPVHILPLLEEELLRVARSSHTALALLLNTVPWRFDDDAVIHGAGYDHSALALGLLPAHIKGKGPELVRVEVVSGCDRDNGAGLGAPSGDEK